jgi:hypothetical protein
MKFIATEFMEVLAQGLGLDALHHQHLLLILEGQGIP